MPKKAVKSRKPAAKPSPDLSKKLRALEEENRELKARLARRAGDGLPVSEVIQQFNTLDLERISEIATRVIPALVGARLCSLFLYDYESHELVLTSHTHSKPLPERVSLKLHKNSVMERALTDRKSINVHGFKAYEEANKVRLEHPFTDRYESETCLSVPLHTANFVVGVLNLADRKDGSPFDPDLEVPAVEHVAGVLSMAIRNCKLFREVQNQAHTDALTQLKNYRAFHESLRTEMHRSQRYTRPLGLVMLDIDSFKELNDKHGHQAGDVALVDLGKVIRATLRREDLAARYGGDEIAIVLPETSGTGCKAVVRRLMNAVREHKFVHDGKRLSVTISAGLALFAADMTITQFVGAADQALYRAKQGGKNRSEVAE